MKESTSESSRKHPTTDEELAAMLKGPAVKDAIRDLKVDLAAQNAFAAHSGLNLPGVGRR